MHNALSNCRRLRGPSLLASVVVLSLHTSGCLFRSNKPIRVFSPPIAAPRQAAIAKTPPVLTAGPDLDITESTSLPETVALPVPMPALPAPPAPAPPRNPTPPKQVTPPPPPAPEPAPPPKITQMFTPAQKSELDRAIDDSLERVRKNLDMLGKKNLTGDQNEVVELIRTFQKQAEQAREQDLVTAVNLARRADLLAKDLIQRLP